MGGKSSVIFYCPLLSRVMVLLNCAESNGAILRSALEPHDFSLLGFREPFLPSKVGGKARIVSTLAAVVNPCRRKGQSEAMSVSNRKWQKERQVDETLRPLRVMLSYGRDGRVCFLVCMHFNITVVLCFAPSLFLRNCKTARASATSSHSGLWGWSRGRERQSQPRGRPAMPSETTPSQPSRLSK